MKKLLFLLLAFTTVVFADSQYTLLVNTAQEVPMYAALFDSIHWFFHGTTGENYLSMLKLIVMFGTIMTIIRATRSVGGGISGEGLDGAGGHQSLIGLASYQLFIVGMLMILYGRESTLIVKHPESLRFEPTATVPEVFGYTVSFFSTLNYKMTKIAEEAFSQLRSQGAGTPYGYDSAGNNIAYGMTGLGYGGLSSALSDASKINLTRMTYSGSDGKDHNIAPQMSLYVKDCVVMPMANTFPDALPSLVSNAGFLQKMIVPAQLESSYPGLNLDTYLVTYGGVTNTCTDFWANEFGSLSTGKTKDGKEVLAQIDSELGPKFGKYMAAIYYSGQLANSIDGSIDPCNASGDLAATACLQGSVWNAGLTGTFNGIFADLGASGNVYAGAMAQGLQEQNIQNYGIGRAMAEYMPVFASFLFMMMVAAFPFMFAFSLMPGGFGILIQFAKTLAWISLWAPMAAILNFFIDYRLTEHIIELSGGAGGISYVDGIAANMQMFDIQSEASMMANLAGGLYAMIPALSWMLVTGSGTMLTGITSGLASAVAGNMSVKGMTESAIERDAVQRGESAGLSSGSEMAYYENMSKSTARAGGAAATKAAYGNYGDDAGDLMTQDIAKAGAVNLGSQRAMGQNMSMGDALDGGSFQGAMKAGNINGQAMALAAYGGDTSDVARTGAMESFSSAMTSKGKADEMSFSSAGNSAYNTGTNEGSKLNKIAQEVSNDTARDAGTVAGAKEAGNIKADAAAVGEADNIMSGTQYSTTKQLNATATIGKNGSMDSAQKSGSLQGLRDSSSMDADAEQFDKELDEGGGDTKKTSRKLKAAARKKLSDEFGAADEALEEETAINSGEYQEVARKQTKQAMLQAKKTYGNNGVTDADIENATDVTAAQAKGAIQGQAQKAANASTIEKTTAAETAFNIEKQMQSFTDGKGSVLSPAVLNSAATLQGGQASGAIQGQAEQFSKIFGDNKTGVVADAKTNTGFQISSSHAEAVGHKAVSPGNDFSAVRKGQAMMTANSDSKMEGLGRNGSIQAAILSGANDGSQMAGDQNADANGDFKRSEKSASRIGSQARRFKNAADLSDSLVQSQMGTKELGNYTGVQSQNKIKAPIKANNMSMSEKDEDDKAEALINSDFGKKMGIKDMESAREYNQAVGRMTKSQRKGEMVAKNSKDYDGAIVELGEDTRDELFNKTSATSGNSKALETKGYSNSWISTSASSATQTMTALNVGGQIAGNSGAIGGAAGFVGAANVQAVAQMAQMNAQDQSQRTSLGSRKMDDSYENRNSASSALSRDQAMLQTGGQEIDVKNYKDTVKAAEDAFKQMSPERHADMMKMLGNNTDDLSKAAAMKSIGQTSSYNLSTSDGYSQSITVGSNGSVGTDSVSGDVGVNIRGHLNYDHKTVSAVNFAMEQGAGEDTLQTMAIGIGVAQDAATVALAQSKGITAAAKAISSRSGGAADPETGAVTGSTGKMGNMAEKYLNKTNGMHINSKTAETAYKNAQSTNRTAGGGSNQGPASSAHTNQGPASNPQPGYDTGFNGNQTLPTEELFMYL